jgi:hypothetical protein
MGRLSDKIRAAIVGERYVVGEHASERLEERGIMEWQVVAAIVEAVPLVERLKAKPNPAVEFQQLLPDGTEFKSVWSYLAKSNVAKLVTVHFFDEE